MTTEISLIALQVLFAVLVVWYYFQTKDRLEKLDKKIKAIDARLALMPQQSSLESEMDEVRRRLEEIRSLVASQVRAGTRAPRASAGQSAEPVAVVGDPVEAARRTGRSRAEMELVMRLQELYSMEASGERL